MNRRRSAPPSCGFAASSSRAGSTAFCSRAPALKGRGAAIKTGTIVDATVIRSASQEDADARWSGHRSRRAIHGYKAHVGADADTALVEEVAITPGNVHDGRAGGGALPDNPGEVYADSAYRGEAFRSAVRRARRRAAGRIDRDVGYARRRYAQQAEALELWRAAHPLPY